MLFSILFTEKSLQICHVGSNAAHQHIDQRDRSHGFNDNNGTRYDDRIVAAFTEICLFASVFCNGGLFS